MNTFKWAEETWVDQGKDGEAPRTKKLENALLMLMIMMMMMMTLLVRLINFDLYCTVIFVGIYM
jgi:hypothetical protein